MRKIAGLIFGNLCAKELAVEEHPRTVRAPCKYFNRRMDQASDQHRKKLSSGNNSAE